MHQNSCKLLVLSFFVSLLGCQEGQNPLVLDSAGEGAVLLKSAISLPGAFVRGNTVTLTQDVTTDETIEIPDGFTLNGAGHTITAVDPAGDHFRGPVVTNAGATANVKNLTVRVAGLKNACDSGGDRLRGIMFEGASGFIRNCKVIGINQGASGCQEGNGIEVRNAPFDGSHPSTVFVEISNNTIKGYQKTGIVANGDVNVTVRNNRVGDSATQQNLAANSIQLGFGAQGSVKFNNVDGNQWLGASNFAASALLLFAVDDVDVIQNNVRGNSDVGLFAVLVSNSNFDNNKIYDKGQDGPHGDFGIANVAGSNNSFTNNKIKGFDTPLFGVNQGNNKVLTKAAVDQLVPKPFIK